MTAAVVGAAVALACFGGDALERRHETASLTDQVTRSRAVLDLAGRRVAGISSYIAPSLAVTGAPQSVTDQLLQIVIDTSTDQQPAVRAAARRVRAVRVVPWHGALGQARDDYAAYLDARAQQLADPFADDGGLADRVSRLRATTQRSLQAALGDAASS